MMTTDVVAKQPSRQLTAEIVPIVRKTSQLDAVAEFHGECSCRQIQIIRAKKTRTAKTTRTARLNAQNSRTGQLVAPARKVNQVGELAEFRRDASCQHVTISNKYANNQATRQHCNHTDVANTYPATHSFPARDAPCRPAGRVHWECFLSAQH
jgi:hypothetical protein